MTTVFTGRLVIELSDRSRHLTISARDYSQTEPDVGTLVVDLTPSSGHLTISTSRFEGAAASTFTIPFGHPILRELVRLFQQAADKNGVLQ